MAAGIDKARVRRLGGLALAMATGLAIAGSPLYAQGPGREVTVTIKTVKALDKLDAFSRADFYAQVTIAGGPPIVSPVAKQAEQIAPNWVLSKRVPNGRHTIRLEVFDKDLTKSEPIDINRLPNKRVLDFTIDTRRCSVGGFAQAHRCGDVIVRGGDENKKAEVAFTVDVR